MGWVTLPDGSQVMAFDRAKYEAAIQSAPPDTFIKMGDLEVDDELVQCSTCKMQMPRSATPYHQHPKTCGTCGGTYDENLKRHEPIHKDEQRGAGTVRFAIGCTEVAL